MLGRGRTAVWLAMALLAMALATAKGEEVVTLTESNFDEAIKKHSFMVVEFYAPWCGHCKSLAPEYEKAAAALKGDKSAGQEIILAKVDATVERNLSEKFGIGGFPTLKIFENHDASSPSEYAGPRDATGIVDYLKKRAGPASREITSDADAKDLMEKNPVIVVNSGKADSTWTSIANSMRDVVVWAHTSNKQAMSAFGVKSGTITMLKKFDEKTVVYSGSHSDAKKIKDFVNEHRVEIGLFVKKGDQNALKVVFEDENKPNVFLFTKDDKAGLDALKAVGKSHRKDMVFAYFVSSDFAEAFSHFSMEKFVDSSLPKVLIEDRKEGLRYLMQESVSQSSLQKFVQGFKAKTIEPYLKSEEAPADNSGPVKVIVGNTYEAEVLKSNKWVFLEAYAPWCGHCKRLEPIWMELGKAFNKEDVIIAKVDATANDLPKALNVKGFPTLMLFKGDGSLPEVYSGGREFNDLANFVTSKTGAKMKEGFKPSIKEQGSSETTEKKILRFMATQFQLPLMGPEYTVSGLWLAAMVVFLLFVASVSLIIACISKEPSAKATASKKQN